MNWNKVVLTLQAESLACFNAAKKVVEEADREKGSIVDFIEARMHHTQGELFRVLAAALIEGMKQE